MSKFHFVTPFYNADPQQVRQCINSCISQSYNDWEMTLIDDASTVCSDYSQHIPADTRVNFTRNSRNMGRMHNVLSAIRAVKDPETIICSLDGDDYLTENDALAFIASAYQQSGCEVLWTAQRWNLTAFNVCDIMPNDVDPYVHPWVTSLLSTFKKGLFNTVPDSNYRDATGEYFQLVTDQALLLPILHNTNKRAFLPLCCYHYNVKVPYNRPADEPTVDSFIRQRGYLST